MDHNIEILFDGKKIEKYIKNSEELVIKNELFKIEYAYYVFTPYRLYMCIDSQEKINKLHKLFDFYIKHKCFFYTKDYLLFDIDKDLFYKSGFWFLNSEEYWNFHPSMSLNYLALTYNIKVVRFIEYLDLIEERNSYVIYLKIYLDLGIVDFLVNKCKLELSKEIYDRFLEILIVSFYYDMHNLIKYHGIIIFKCMCKNNILGSLLDYLHKKEYICRIIYLSVETNQTEIIDYLLKYGLEKDEVKLNDYNLLISLIKNDNVETFLYTIQNVSLPDTHIQKMIEGSGEFITKEYIEILLNNCKLNLDNLKLLKKSVKNNPDKKLKKYVKKLILME